MATLNHGILTNAGQNLFNNVIQGDSKITYTKVVFCDDKELLNMSDDEIQDLTQINVNNSLETQPVSYNEGLLQGQNGEQASEVVVRAIVSNAGSTEDSGNVIQPPLTNGFYPYVSALYASDGSNEILYGLYLKDQPGYMPAYDGHTPQPLQFTWRLYASTVDNFNLSDTKDVYATINDLHAIDGKCQETIAQQTKSLSQTDSNLQQQITSNKNDISNSNAVNPSNYTFNNSTINLNDCTDVGTYGFYESTVVNGPVGTNIHYFGYLYVTNNVSNTNYEFKDRIQLLFINSGGTADTSIYTRTVDPNHHYGKWNHLITQTDLVNISNQLENLKQSALQFIPAGGFLDLNNERFVNQSGIYFFNAKLANAPKGITHGYGLLIVYYNGGMTVQQLYMADPDYSSFRINGDSGWGNWIQPANNDSINSLNNRITNLSSQSQQYSNQTAKNAMNQANEYTDDKSTQLNNTINKNANNLQNQLNNSLSFLPGGSYISMSSANFRYNTGIYFFRDINIDGGPHLFTHAAGFLVVLSQGGFTVQKLILTSNDYMIIRVNDGQNWHPWHQIF